MKQRTVVWKPLEYQGLEHLTLTEQKHAVLVESVVIGVNEQGAFRLNYRLECDSRYSIRKVNMTLAGGAELHLRSDGQGHWFKRDGQLIPALNGCLDVDIAATPFTNTLPIRRVMWHPGQVTAFNVVYVSMPDLSVRVEAQRYTCVEHCEDGRLFGFEQLSSGFSALLRVDADGLVIDYPELFSRVESG